MLERARAFLSRRRRASSTELRTAARLPHLSAILLGFGFCALVSCLLIGPSLGRRVSAWDKAQTLWIAAGQVATLGLVVVPVVAVLFALSGRKPRLAGGMALFVVASLAVPHFVDEDLGGAAFRFAADLSLPYWLLLRIGTSAVAAALIAVWFLGVLLRRPWVRLAALPIAAAVLWAHGTEFAYSYEGLHLVASFGAGLLASSSLVAARVPIVLGGGRLKWALLLLFGLCAAPVLGAPTPHRALVELGKHPLAVLTPFPLHRGDRASADFQPSPAEAPYYQAADLPETLPSSPRLVKRAAIVLLIGIDSLRADVLEKEEHRKLLPNLFALRDEGFYFQNARSAGSSTGPAIAALFSGRYYSQQYWVPHPKRPFEPFPHEDLAPRFPEILSRDLGVPTVTVDSVGWLTNEFGIVRGFSDEQSLRTSKAYPLSSQQFDALLPRLEAQREGPLFAFAHLLDAHSPYTSAGKHGTPFERYLRELAMVDAQLGRVKRALSQERLWQRTVVLIYSDHGEAFGEHGSQFHGHGLYEELLRIPLIIRVPNQAPHTFQTPVSLVDLGPTVLDLFGAKTPGTMMGTSLVPMMSSRTEMDLARPILAEARLKRAMVFPDGAKIIHDTRLYSVEQYDLVSDPQEADNTFSAEDAKSVQRLSRLKRFFEARAEAREGYSPPFRRW